MIQANKGYAGWKESDEVNNWLSELFGEEVMILRAAKERVTKLNHERLYKSQDDDRKGAFITDAALHLINTESVKDL